MKAEKDKPPPVVDCGNCTGDNPKEGNLTCAGCIALQLKTIACKALVSVEA